MSSSPFHVIVVGGGIGGLCLVQALKAAGVSVAVYERNPSPTDWLQGYRININPIGSRALHECLPPVLWVAFIATAGKPSVGFGFLTEQLKELLVLDETLMIGSTNGLGETHYPVSRIALRHILLAGLDDVIQFGKTFERYEQSPTGKVTAFFTDGSSATGDVLVGADGSNSRIRKQLLVPLLPALHDYEAQMIKYGFEAVHESLQNTKRAISNSRAARLAGRTFFRLCSTFPALKKRAFGNNRADLERSA